MKNIFISLILILLNVVAKGNDNNNNIQFENSLLWKVSGNELTNPSYLYGTMHLLCDKSNSEKAKVQSAIDASKQLYLEVDMFNPEQSKDMLSLLANEVKIKDLDDVEKKQQLLTLTEKHLGMKGALIENTNLLTLFSMLAYMTTDSCAMPSSVEDILESKFNHDRSKIAGLETLAQQIQFIKDSEVASIDNTIIALEEFEEMKVMLKDLNNLYMSENITDLYSMMITPSDLYTQSYIDKMMDVLLVQRNKNWVIQIPVIAIENPTFFGVGAGHLPGKNGVINLLREAGYSVEAVMDSK
jgi:uncharacterized protein YbaP (TraB family)